MTERLDISAQRVDGCYFLRQWSSDPADFTGTSPGAYKHVYTYWKSERTIRAELEAMIAGARHKIFIASFLLGDAALLDALTAAASRLLGGVYVITQLDEQRLAKGLQELADGSDPEPGSDGVDAAIQAQKKRFDQMTRNGIYVRGHLNCHAKFAVVDDEIALVTSANLMTSALDFTGENGVVVTVPAEVQRLARLFGRLWRTGCAYEARPGQAYRLSKLREREPWPDGVPAPAAAPAPGAIWTDGSEHHILAAIQDIVGRAESELLLASFGLTRLKQQHELLLDPIREAVGRGVRVMLLIRPRRNLARHLAEATELAQAGVEVYGDTRTHVKAAIADDRHGALFSANFDFEHGLTSGVEVGCRLDGTPALADAARYLRHAIEQATLVYAVRPTHRDLAERLDADWQARWPLGERVEVEAPAEERAALAQAAEQGPVLFTIPAHGPLELHAGSRQWRLTPGVLDRYELTRSASGGGTDSRGILARWLTTPSGGGRRGVCATLIEWAGPG